jgi:hypothetical protein
MSQASKITWPGSRKSLLLDKYCTVLAFHTATASVEKHEQHEQFDESGSISITLTSSCGGVNKITNIEFPGGTVTYPELQTFLERQAALKCDRTHGDPVYSVLMPTGAVVSADCRSMPVKPC